jgi:hypothetical protein
MNRKFMVFTLLLLIPIQMSAQEKGDNGSIEGSVSDSLKKEPLLEEVDSVQVTPENKIAFLPVISSIPEGPVLSDELQGYISASGDLKEALSGKEDNKTATGSLQITFEQTKKYERMRKNNSVITGSIIYQVTGAVSVASVDDTVQVDHGSSLLDPKIGKNSGFFQIMRSNSIGKNNHFVLRNYVYLSTITWQVSGTEDSGSTINLTKNGSVLGVGLLGGLALLKRIGNGHYNFAGLTLQAGPVCRALLGDLKNNSKLRKEILNSDKTLFAGLEVVLAVFYKGITAGLDFYYFGGDIPGFSKGQVTGGISISTDLIEF